MGLASFPTPAHRLDTEAVIIMLKSKTPRRARKKAEQKLLEVASMALFSALHRNQLEHFYPALMGRVPNIVELNCFTLLQIHSAAHQCLTAWQVAVESAISHWQHSGAKKPAKGKKYFKLSFAGQELLISLEDALKLRVFLNKELQLPFHEKPHDWPSYEGMCKNGKA